MFSFDPERVATLEAEGWRAYYDRRWGRVLRLIVILCQEQFLIPFPVSLAAAYHATRAASAFAPARHDTRAVQAAYACFYRLARRYSGLRFDSDQVAALELEYNIVHRNLAGVSDKTVFVDTMAHLHAALFGLSTGQALESARERVLAATIVDRITGGDSTDPATDWAHIRAALYRCYSSIQAELAKELSAEAPGAAVPARTPAYAFTTTWDVAAPIQAVWDVIYDSGRWPSWWPYVALVQDIAPGDARGIGAVRRYRWTTQLPYTFVFDSRVTRVEPPHRLEASVSGQLNGVGCWTLTPTSGGTQVQYDWNVRTGVAWMNALAPVARPLFAWNHRAVMRSGGQGLGRLIGARVQVRT